MKIVGTIVSSYFKVFLVEELRKTENVRTVGFDDHAEL
jgi:hypothetical protein